MIVDYAMSALFVDRCARVGKHCVGYTSLLGVYQCVCKSKTKNPCKTPLFSLQQCYGSMLMCKVCLPNFACVWEEVRLRCKIRIVILICSINQFIKQSNKSDVYNKLELKMSLCALKLCHALFSNQISFCLLRHQWIYPILVPVSCLCGREKKNREGAVNIVTNSFFFFFF